MGAGGELRIWDVSGSGSSEICSGSSVISRWRWDVGGRGFEKGVGGVVEVCGLCDCRGGTGCVSRLKRRVYLNKELGSTVNLLF